MKDTTFLRLRIRRLLHLNWFHSPPQDASGLRGLLMVHSCVGLSLGANEGEGARIVDVRRTCIRFAGHGHTWHGHFRRGRGMRVLHSRHAGAVSSCAKVLREDAVLACFPTTRVCWYFVDLRSDKGLGSVVYYGLSVSVAERDVDYSSRKKSRGTSPAPTQARPTCHFAVRPKCLLQKLIGVFLATLG